MSRAAIFLTGLHLFLVGLSGVVLLSLGQPEWGQTSLELRSTIFATQMLMYGAGMVLGAQITKTL
jgi:hypothetical protein